MQPVSPNTTRERCHHGELPSLCLICRRDIPSAGTTFAEADREQPPAAPSIPPTVIKFWIVDDEEPAPKAMRAAA